MVQNDFHFFEFLFVILCFFIVRSIARPLGRVFGIKDTRSELPNFFKCVYYYLRKIRRIFVNDDAVDDKHHESNGCIMNGNVSPPSAHKFRSRSGSKLIHLVPRKSTLDKFSECW